MGFRKRSTSIMMLALLLATLASVKSEVLIVKLSEGRIRLYPNGMVDSASEDQSHFVKLVTGDVVSVTYLRNGQKTVCILPTDSAESSRSFLTYESRSGTYVLPSDVSLEKLDFELFNVDYLVSEGYHQMTSLPVIVSVSDVGEQGTQQVVRELQNSKAEILASFYTQSLLSVKLPLETIKEATQILLTRSDVKKIWLDRKVHVSLSESVPLIGAPELWNLGYNGTGIEIAILDTGIDKTHPDLDDLDDNPTTIDPKVIREVDFTDEGSTIDGNGHGTHCAGIAAGTGAASGGKNKGVAPGAKLWNVKVLTSAGGGYESWITAGVRYAAYGPDGIARTGDEADIISMSLGRTATAGSSPLCLVVDEAVDAGVVVVIAAGNSHEYFTVGDPGIANKAITIGASDKKDKLATFSSKGPTIDFRLKPDVLAPGVNINSTVPYEYYGTHYQMKDGTSMATPHVAGAAALLLEACWKMPSGWSLPEYVKNTMISTAKDLGYNVFEQGGGRIDVPSAASTGILVDPATISFGSYSAENVTDEAVITFFNLNATSNRILNLDLAVHDVSNGNQVDCATLNVTTLSINPNSNASILLTIKTPGSASLYSGKIEVSVDTGETLRVIFGFARMARITITKTNRSGYPAADDHVNVFGEPGFPGVIECKTDGNGNVTVYVTKGNYHIVSHGPLWKGYERVYTIAENVSVSGDTVVHLDERNTVVVDFDPNKPGQKIAYRLVALRRAGLFAWYFSGLYPESTRNYVSPVSIVKAVFTYEYYPEEYYAAESPEWHTLVYGPDELSENVTFVADYGSLVRRTTDYKTAMTPESTTRYIFAAHPNHAGDYLATGFSMQAPKRMIQWLSPEPAFYFGIYCQTGYYGWEYANYPLEGSYQPGSDPYFAYGEHPFTYSFDTYLGTQNLTLTGTMSEDVFGNRFTNAARDKAGNITILEDGLVVYQKEIGDWFYEVIDYSGTPVFAVIVEGNTGIMLSTKTITELTFTSDLTQDHQPPRVKMKMQGSNSDSSVKRGMVLVDVTPTDDTAVSSLKLEFSLNDGLTWTRATEATNIDHTYQFSLGVLSEGNYVSLRANVTDVAGNSVSQTVIRGSYVVPWGDVALTNASVPKTVIGQGYPLYINVTVENQGYLPETFNVTLLASRRLVAYVVNLSLFGSASYGWGFTPQTMSSPGPIITLNKGDVANLTLTSLDGITHNFFVDYNRDKSPSLDEPKAPDFSETVNYQFVANALGTFNYYCQYDKPVMYGTFIVKEPQTTTTEISRQQVYLNNGVSAILPFTWDTASFSKGSYIISAQADTVLNEIDTADNTYFGGNVIVAVKGDITGPISNIPDGKVDKKDIAAVGAAYGSYFGHPQWNPNADINNDKRIDIKDLALIAKEFGKTAP